MDTALECYACGSKDDRESGPRCDCGEPRWFSTHPDGFDWPQTTDRSMWRYEDLLPVSDSAGLAAAVGGTPMVRVPRLDEDLDAQVHVKYEGANPTGTFKDRGSAVGVTAALDGGRAVATVSHGNMARSMAAHASSVGLPCLVFVPADIPASRLGLIARHDPTILRVNGGYDRLYHETLRIGNAHSLTVVNSDTPLRVAGQKTTGLEIADWFAPETPDALVMPVSSGGHASGVWKAFRELATAGTITQVPRLYFVQAAACAPVAEAFQRGAEHVTAVDANDTIAYSIANSDPPSGTRTLTAARTTGGAVLAVDDEAILSARRDLASKGGLFVESACATVLAGARQLSDAGEFRSDDDVVLVATGTGYTERDVDPASVDAPTVSIAELEGAVTTRLQS